MDLHSGLVFSRNHFEQYVSLFQARSLDITNLGGIFRDRITLCGSHYWLSNGDANCQSGRDHRELHFEVLSEEREFFDMRLNPRSAHPLPGFSRVKGECFEG